MRFTVNHRPAPAILLALLILCLCPAAARAADGNLWDEQSVNAFAFAGTDQGLAVGDGGMVLTTADGGRAWRRVETGTVAPLLAVAFADHRVAYAAGGYEPLCGAGSVGVLLRSVDAGLSWQPVVQRAARFWGLATRREIVVAWGEPSTEMPAAVLLSRDAGLSWQPLRGRLSAPIIAMLWSQDNAGGYFLSADGRAWRWTGDELNPWSQPTDTATPAAAPAAAPATPPAATPAAPGRLTAAHFFGPDSWLVAVESGAVMMTADSGRTWKEVTTDGPPQGRGVRQFTFLSRTEGWLVGVGPDGAQFTTTGGDAWHRTGPPPAGPLRAAIFHDAWNGLLAGPFGTIYRTTDGGGRWTCVRGAPRRAALWLVAPFGSAADWPLASLLGHDRGFRTLLWSATTPRDDLLLISERRLRDAALALGGAEAMILSPTTTGRLDAYPGFAWQPQLPRGEFSAPDPAAASAIVAAAVTLWPPTAILSPDPAATDGELSHVGHVVAEGLRTTESAIAKNVRRWLADPDNETADRAADEDNQYEVALHPLTAGESLAIYHGVRAQLAAAIWRRWPLPLPESLGYKRVAAPAGSVEPLALLRDLESGEGPTTPPPAAHPAPSAASSATAPAPSAESPTRRSIGPATVAFRRRDTWEKEARTFYPLFRAELDQGSFSEALRRVGQLDPAQLDLQLPQACLMELAARANLAGQTAIADQAMAQLVRRRETAQPLLLSAIFWLMDRQAGTEWQLLAAAAPTTKPKPPSTAGAATITPDYFEFQGLLAALMPQRPQRGDLAQQWYSLRRQRGPVGNADFARYVRESTPPSDGLLAILMRLESWLRNGQRGPAPLKVVALQQLPPEENPPRGDQDQPGATTPSGSESQPGAKSPSGSEGQPGAKAPDSSGVQTGIRVPLSNEPAPPAKRPDPASKEQLVDLAAEWQLKVREQREGLVIILPQSAAEDRWLTIDMDRDARTALAEPLLPDAAAKAAASQDGATSPTAEGGAASPSAIGTAAAPLWVRHPAAWLRDTKDGQLAIRLNYQSIGGRPPAGTVWLITLRKQPLGHPRPTLDESLRNVGSFAVEFKGPEEN